MYDISKKARDILRQKGFAKIEIVDQVASVIAGGSTIALLITFPRGIDKGVANALNQIPFDKFTLVRSGGSAKRMPTGIVWTATFNVKMNDLLPDIEKETPVKSPTIAPKAIVESEEIEIPEIPEIEDIIELEPRSEEPDKIEEILPEVIMGIENSGNANKKSVKKRKYRR